MVKKNIAINPNCKLDTFDMPKLIFSQLSSISDGWKTLELVESGLTATYIYKTSEKYPEQFYGFAILIESSGNNRIRIEPTVGFLTNGNPNYHYRIYNTALYNKDPDGPYIYTNDRIASDLTIGISKNSKAYMLSVVPQGSDYILMNGVCGEDSDQNVYAFSPAILNEPNNPDSLYIPMAFVMCRDGAIQIANSNLKTNNHGSEVYHQADKCMGTIIKTDKLVLSPFINPITGASCQDLFLPIGGPRTARLYDISVGNRKFLTGSSSPARLQTSPITDQDYNVMYKVFMEV